MTYWKRLNRRGRTYPQPGYTTRSPLMVFPTLGLRSASRSIESALQIIFTESMKVQKKYMYGRQPYFDMQPKHQNQDQFKLERDLSRGFIITITFLSCSSAFKQLAKRYSLLLQGAKWQIEPLFLYG